MEGGNSGEERRISSRTHNLCTGMTGGRVVIVGGYLGLLMIHWVNVKYDGDAGHIIGDDISMLLCAGMKTLVQQRLFWRRSTVRLRGSIASCKRHEWWDLWWDLVPIVKAWTFAHGSNDAVNGFSIGIHTTGIAFKTGIGCIATLSFAESRLRWRGIGQLVLQNGATKQ